MAINFPDNPSNGDTHAGFIYNSTKGVWEASAASVPMSDSPPANPAQGDLWFDSSVAKTYIYYNDGSSSQWVQLNPSGGSDGADGADGADGSSVTAYANFAAVPSTGNTVGDFAFTSDTKALYMWDGTEWDRVALGNDESPVILTEPPTTEQELNSDGTTSTVTMLAEDPEGFDITYGITYNTANNARPSQLSADTTINQSSGVYTFTPTTTTSNGGTFRARLSASDGARITTRFVDFKLEFGYSYFRWYITAKRGSDTHMQVDELEFRDSSGVVSWSGASVTQAYPSDFNNSRGALIDGSTSSSKALIQHTPSTGSPAWWTISMPSPVNLVSYRFKTGNDYANRDPWNWQMQGSNDNSNWTTLHTVTAGDSKVTTSRLTWTGLFVL